MATRKEIFGALDSFGQGFSKMGAALMERERYDTQKALEEEEAERNRKLFPKQLEAAEAGATEAKVRASEALVTADKRKDADAANQALMAENAAAGWTVDPEDQGQVGTWKAELNALNRFRAKENKPALSVQEFVTAKRTEKQGRQATEAEEKRKGEKHTSDMETDKYQRRLLGAQATKAAKSDSSDATSWQVTDTDKGKVHVNPKTGETRPLVDAEGKPIKSAKEPGVKLTEAQTKTVGAAGMAKQMLDDIASSFKAGGLGGASGLVSDVAESVPFLGGKIAPKTAEYNDKRRLVAEIFLREATGAAAPAEEVKFYTNLLPEAGDSESQAQSALNAFRQAVKAKVKGVTETLRAQGREDDAKSIESNLDALFGDSVNIKEEKKADPYESMSTDQLREELARKRSRLAKGGG